MLTYKDVGFVISPSEWQGILTWLIWDIRPTIKKLFFWELRVEDPAEFMPDFPKVHLEKLRRVSKVIQGGLPACSKDWQLERAGALDTTECFVQWTMGQDPEVYERHDGSCFPGKDHHLGVLFSPTQNSNSCTKEAWSVAFQVSQSPVLPPEAHKASGPD